MNLEDGSFFFVQGSNLKKIYIETYVDCLVEVLTVALRQIAVCRHFAFWSALAEGAKVFGGVSEHHFPATCARAI